MLISRGVTFQDGQRTTCERLKIHYTRNLEDPAEIHHLKSAGKSVPVKNLESRVVLELWGITCKVYVRWKPPRLGIIQTTWIIFTKSSCWLQRLCTLIFGYFGLYCYTLGAPPRPTNSGVHEGLGRGPFTKMNFTGIVGGGYPQVIPRETWKTWTKMPHKENFSHPKERQCYMHPGLTLYNWMDMLERRVI